MYLLDSNIIVYLLNGDDFLDEYLSGLRQDRFSISLVTRLEVMLGAKKQGLSFEDAGRYMDSFIGVNLDKAVVKVAVSLSDLLQKKLKFKDLVIAATAKLKGYTLITADKDFKEIPGLKVKVVSVSG